MFCIATSEITSQCSPIADGRAYGRMRYDVRTVLYLGTPAQRLANAQTIVSWTITTPLIRPDRLLTSSMTPQPC